MCVVPRGGGAYTRPRIIQIGLPRPLVISIRRRITLPSCAGRGAAGDTIYIIRSPLSLAPFHSPPPLAHPITLARSSERPRIRDARAHDPFDIISICASAAKYIYIYYILCTYIIIENPSYNPFSYTRTHTYTHLYKRTSTLPALTVLHGIYSRRSPLYDIYIHLCHPFTSSYYRFLIYYI